MKTIVLRKFASAVKDEFFFDFTPEGVRNFRVLDSLIDVLDVRLTDNIHSVDLLEAFRDAATFAGFDASVGESVLKGAVMQMMRPLTSQVLGIPDEPSSDDIL